MSNSTGFRSTSWFTPSLSHISGSCSTKHFRHPLFRVFMCNRSKFWLQLLVMNHMRLGEHLVLAPWRAPGARQPLSPVIEGYSTRKKASTSTQTSNLRVGPDAEPLEKENKVTLSQVRRVSTNFPTLSLNCRVPKSCQSRLSYQHHGNLFKGRGHCESSCRSATRLRVSKVPIIVPNLWSPRKLDNSLRNDQSGQYHESNLVWRTESWRYCKNILSSEAHGHAGNVSRWVGFTILMKRRYLTLLQSSVLIKRCAPGKLWPCASR